MIWSSVQLVRWQQEKSFFAAKMVNHSTIKQQRKQIFVMGEWVSLIKNTERTIIIGSCGDMPIEKI